MLPRMNLIKTIFLVKNLNYLGCYSLPECWGQPPPCCSSPMCGSASKSSASSLSDLGLVHPPELCCPPCSATSAPHGRSVEASFLPSDLHTKSCRLLQHEIFVSGGLGGKSGQREGGFSINRALSSPVPFLLSHPEPHEVATFYSCRCGGFNLSSKYFLGLDERV